MKKNKISKKISTTLYSFRMRVLCIYLTFLPIITNFDYFIKEIITKTKQQRKIYTNKMMKKKKKKGLFISNLP